jgi:hypothetical protein
MPFWLVYMETYGADFSKPSFVIFISKYPHHHQGIHMGRILLVNSLQVGTFLAVSLLSMGLWPLIASALPLSIPPSLPPALALPFLFVYIPLLSFSILFGPGPDGVMKATPRKNIKTKPRLNSEEEEEELSISELLVEQQQKDRKVKDEQRFFVYLLMRCMLVIFAIFVTGWLACGGVFKERVQSKGVEQDYQSMIQYTIITEADRYKFWLIQDIMSVALLFGLLSQAATLMERGASWSMLPTVFLHGYFYIASVVSILVHGGLLLIRAYSRNGVLGGGDRVNGIEAYSLLNWSVWVAAIVICPIISIILCIVLNKHDGTAYKRYLQYLRLEFDTRLGMHSPR